MMKIMDQLCCVISSLWRGLRTRKLCVARRPWIEIYARLFNCVYLECCCCFMLTLIIATDTNHCWPCVVLYQKKGLDSCCDIKSL